MLAGSAKFSRTQVSLRAFADPLNTELTRLHQEGFLRIGPLRLALFVLSRMNSHAHINY